MKISRDLWISVIGVGISTLVYSVIMGAFSLWMGSAAFIMASFYFGLGCPTKQLGNIVVSFVMGIVWALLSFALLQNAFIAQLWPSAIMFGLMTSLAIFLQGTIMPFTLVPGWLISWGTTMLIISNVTVTHWGTFLVQLFISMLFGPFFIAGAANLGGAYWQRWFPKRKSAEQALPREDVDEESL